MWRPWALGLFALTFLPSSEAEVLKYTGFVVSGKIKLKCSFTLMYTPAAVNIRSSKIVCKPKNKKAIKITNYEIRNKNPPCTFLLSMTIIKGKGKLSIAKVECSKPTTEKTTTEKTTTSKTTTTITTTSTPPPPTTTEVPVLMSNCGPKDCNIWCNKYEQCNEDTSIVCVKAPCCPRWSCSGIQPPSPTPTPPTPTPPTPTPPAPTPTVPTSSKCCKERMFERSTYILVGEEESLPSCGNGCLYRKETEGNDGQLFCFRESFSDFQNQCDFTLAAPIPLVEFSTWSEWTRCEGDCEGGKSTRERTCIADITDELGCNGPTKQVKNCEISCEADEMARQMQIKCTLEQVNVQGYPCTYYFDPKLSNWDEAQQICKDKYKGKLWEPASEAEYSAVVTAVDGQTNGEAGRCSWWLGLFNWNDGTPDSTECYLSSTVTDPPTAPPNHEEPSPRNGVISSFITVNDGQDGGTQNCVHTRGGFGWNQWRDLRCRTGLPFICQSCPPPCSCSFNNVSYPCGSTIKTNPHCCSEMVCNKQGIIEDIQVYSDANGKPESGCCIWRGKMIKDGAEFGLFWRRYVCCRGEILSKRWWWPWKPFPLPIRPISSVLPISEGLEIIVQENTYSNSTGILEIKVPAHKNYTDSIYLLHQDSDTSLLKTNNTCQISTVPPYINVAEMAEKLEGLEKENNTATETNTVTTYVLKARRKRYGIKKRQDLLPEVQDHCQNEPVIETEDFNVNKTEFEKYNAGELIVVEKEEKTRLCETHYEVCSKEGPIACGYGWTNPDPNAPVPGFTFHQVSDGSICVNCNVELPGPPACNNGFCECKDIKSKIDLMDCVLEPDTIVVIVEGDDVIHQKLHYNSEEQARSISITSPAHNDLQSLEIVMHAATNGYWHGHAQNNHLIKVGDDCFVSTLRSNIFPVDIALGIQEIQKGNNVTGKEDEIEVQGVLIGLQSLEEAEKNSLHPDIKSRCSNSEIKDFKEIPITKDQSNDLRNGKVILIEPETTRSNCQLMSAATTNNNSTSCWRWPNPGTGQQVFIHHVITSVITVTCCKNLPGFPTCCDDLYDDYCDCDDINQQNFHTCIPPLINEISAVDLYANGTALNVSQTFIFDRENGGSMRIEVEEHKDYKESTLIFNDTNMVLKNGNDPCAVFSGVPSVTSPLQVALDADKLKKKLGNEVQIKDQIREDYVLIKSSETPEITETLNICENYYAADLMLISPTDYENLESGNIIFISKDTDISRSPDTCNLQEACATNNGSSCFRFPAPGGSTIYVHDVISSPVCLKCCESGSDPNYCRCSDITDSSSFQSCIGPRPDALIVVSGANEDSKSVNTVEILIKNEEGDYISRGYQSCYFDSFPVETSSATGALYLGLPTVCVGYTKNNTANPESPCYQLSTNGKWDQAFELENSLKQGGSSILFHFDDNVTFPIWLFVGGDPDGLSTEIYGNNTNYVGMFDLPTVMNLPCMVKISNKEGFLLAIPKFEAATTNFAWILDGENSTWTRLPDALEKRSGPACGLLQNSRGRFIVVAGGYKSSTSEILNLDTLEWSEGPQLPNDVYGGSMVSVMDGQELVLIGGFDSTATGQILRMNSSMKSWEPAGAMNNPRFNAVAMSVPVENLPENFDMGCF